MNFKLPEHPRFPYAMSLDVRIAIGDELDITLAGYPMYRAAESRDHALTVYAEQLGGFQSVDVREGFRLARAKSVTYAPTPTVVRQCCAEAVASRSARERDRERVEAEETFTPPDNIPDWRAVLDGISDRMLANFQKPRGLLGGGEQ